MGTSGSVTSRQYDSSIDYQGEEYFSNNDAEAMTGVAPGYQTNPDDHRGDRLKAGPAGDDGEPTAYAGAFITNGVAGDSASGRNLEAAGNSEEPDGTRFIAFRVDARNTDSIISALQDQGYIPNEPVENLGQLSIAVLERAVDDGLLIWQNGELVVSPQYTPGEIFDPEAAAVDETASDEEVAEVDETASDEEGAEVEEPASGEEGAEVEEPASGEQAATVDETVSDDEDTNPLRFETYPLSPANAPQGDYVFEQNAEGVVTVTDPRAVKHTLTDDQLAAAGLSKNSHFGDIGRAIESGEIVLDGSAQSDDVGAAGSNTAEISPDHPYHIEKHADGSFTYNLTVGTGKVEVSDSVLAAVGLNRNSTAEEVAAKFADKTLVYRDGEIQATVSNTTDHANREVMVWDASGDEIGAGYFVQFTGEGHHQGVTQIPDEVLKKAGLTTAADRTAERVGLLIEMGIIVWDSQEQNDQGGLGEWVHRDDYGN